MNFTKIVQEIKRKKETYKFVSVKQGQRLHTIDWKQARQISVDSFMMQLYQGLRDRKDVAVVDKDQLVYIFGIIDETGDIAIFDNRHDKLYQIPLIDLRRVLDNEWSNIPVFN